LDSLLPITSETQFQVASEEYGTFADLELAKEFSDVTKPEPEFININFCRIVVARI
jgi:hypothetical protein